MNHRKEKLANSWGNWNNIWSWGSWLLPWTGPLFMLFAVLLFGPCILNTITRIITSRIESINLHDNSTIQPPKQWRALNVLPKHEMMLSTMNDRSIKRGEWEEKLKFYIISCSFCLCNSACSLQSLDHVGHILGHNTRNWSLSHSPLSCFLQLHSPWKPT